MNHHNFLTFVIAAFIVLLLSASTGSTSIFTIDQGQDISRPEVGETIYLAHHFGNRPDGLDDPENVHGGDNLSDNSKMPEEDPNGDDFPEEPDSRPDEIPGN